MLLMAMAQSPIGYINGTVYNSAGDVLPNAKIILLGGTDSTYSDADGKFALSLPEGKNNLRIEAKGFDFQFIEVEVKAGKESYVVVTLLPQSTGSVIVAVNKLERSGTNKWANDARGKSPQIVDIITAEDLGKTSAITIGDVLKRMPGATIMEGKFANIRGMYDRYNTGYLNGAPLPSTESDRKAFSFDMIPSNLLDNLMVVKTATPDMTGDFAGGIIKINTKSIPVKMTQSLSFGLKMHSLATFRPMENMISGKGEYFGFISSGNGFPAVGTAAGNPSEQVKQTQKFNNDWSTNTFRPMPAPRFSYSLGMPIKLKNKRELGMMFSLNYALNQSFSASSVAGYDLSDNHLKSLVNDRSYRMNVQSGGLANFSYRHNLRNRIDFRNLYTITYDANTLTRKGISDYDDQKGTEGYSSQATRNRLSSTQFNGSHLFGKSDTKLEWLVNYGSTKREIPDYRIAQYSTVENSRSLVFNDFFNSGSGRFFSNMNEGVLSSSIDLSRSIYVAGIKNNLKVGLFYQDRQRNFASREFVYGPNKPFESNNTPEQDLSIASLNAKGIYLIEKTTRDADEYKGHSTLKAAYLMNETQIAMSGAKKPRYLKLVYGARVEQFGQQLNNAYFDKLGRDMANPGTVLDILPSINTTLPIGKKNQVRVSYGKTVNRAEMRELAPFSFYNFAMNSEILGNKNLQRAEVHNLDMRYEIYSKNEDMISIGAFYKRIINPIEFTLDPTQAQIRTFTYQNEKSAEIRGIELEIRQNIGFMLKRKQLKGLEFYSNLAYIHSAVQFKNASAGMQNRSLQGQSPYVLNFSLFYKDEKTGLLFNASFNRIGDRIAYIGLPKSVQPFGMDIYEKSRSVLEFQIGKTFKKGGTLKLTVADVLAQSQVFYQDVDANKKYNAAKDNTVFKFSMGSTMTLGYNVNF